MLALHKKSGSRSLLELGSTCSKLVEIGKVDRNLIILYCKQLEHAPNPPFLPFPIGWGDYKNSTYWFWTWLVQAAEADLKKKIPCFDVGGDNAVHPSRGSRRYHHYVPLKTYFEPIFSSSSNHSVNSYGEGDIFLFLSWSSRTREKREPWGPHIHCRSPVLGGVIGINHNHS